MTSNRKRKGDKAEAEIAKYYESLGGVTVPLSPSYPGTDIIWFWHGIVTVAEVKGRKQSRVEKHEAICKVLGLALKVKLAGGFKAVRSELWEKLDDGHWLLTNALTNETSDMFTERFNDHQTLK